MYTYIDVYNNTTYIYITAREEARWLNCTLTYCILYVIPTYEKMYVCMYAYLPNPSARAGYNTRSIFKRSLTGLNSYEKVYVCMYAYLPLLLHQLPHQGWRTQPVLLFTHSWRENNRIHIFSRGISAIRNAISLVQNLNSCRCVHFLRR